MAMGPITIFDKSFLQALNPDEAVWFGNFYLANITPLFFAETLADLDKEVAAGRTPEQVVGNIAYKTPILGAEPNLHHTDLCISNLLGQKIPMGRLPIIGGGRAVSVDGQTGMVFEQPPEIDALQRWQEGKFLEVERSFARKWREALATLNLDEARPLVQRLWGGRMEAADLADAKNLAEDMVGGTGRAYEVLMAALAFFNVPKDLWVQIGTRWKMAGEPPLPTFAPYAAHVFTVDMVNFLALASDLKSIGRASSRIDFAYLYYLPFCMVFTSSDRLHRTMVPLFLGDDQAFVWGEDLKNDLRKLDAHYSELPADVREQGIMRFAPSPPREGAFLTVDLWDRFLPKWRVREREREVEPKPLPKEIMDRMKKIGEAPAVPGLERELNSNDFDAMLRKRKMPVQMGKWRLLPPGIEHLSDDD